MRQIIILLSLLTITSLTYGHGYQFQLINKKTNQWLIYTGADGQYYEFSLITKTINCDIKKIEISKEMTPQFLDSLENNGWSRKIKIKSGIKEFMPTVELNSINYYKSEDGDSVFQFIFKIKLTEIKSSLVRTQMDTLYGTERQTFLNAISKQDYKFEELEIQKETSIISVILRSWGLLDVIKTRNVIHTNSKRYFF